MMENNELFTGDINEFTDWVTGTNFVTGNNETEGKPVSGGSIRKLLQNKLKTPFIIYEDIKEGLYRMFSSEESKNLWLKNKEVYNDLELFSFVRPTDYVINIDDLDTSPRYLLGTKSSADSIINFSWFITKGSAKVNDELEVTFNIIDANKNTNSFTKYYNDGVNINEDIVDYILPGENVITITAKGVNTGVFTSVSIRFIIVSLMLKSTFEFNKGYNNDSIIVPVELTRNYTSGNTYIDFYIDEGFPIKKTVQNTTGINYNDNVILVFQNTLSAGQHTLQICATIELEGKTFRSNTLYYNFIVYNEEYDFSQELNSNRFINLNLNFDNVIPPVSKEDVKVLATQFESVNLSWGYYTNEVTYNTAVDVEWGLIQYNKENEKLQEINLGIINAVKGKQSPNLSFIPEIYSINNNNVETICKLSAKITSNNNILDIKEFPIVIYKSNINIQETLGYELKLKALGKLNSSNSKNIWEYKGIKTTFVNIPFDGNNGWYDNSFRTIGKNKYANIIYNAFKNVTEYGKTIEVEFLSEKINNIEDIIINIGSIGNTRISITPNSATLYADGNNNAIISTKFKEGERIKLAFIINTKNNNIGSNLVYIINNGIIERAASWEGKSLKQSSGNIIIGNSDSGVRVFNIRVYNRAITLNDELNNFILDTNDFKKRASLIYNNNILSEGVINYDLVKNKIDTIYIEGDLSKILNQNTNKEDSYSTVNITRICPSDTSKNFTLTNGSIRKHGQSTLNYPISSMKFWTNKSTDINKITSFECLNQKYLNLSKNRYKIKNDSIPANKFILQANYADSSGSQNGSLMRFIQDTWYNAVIDGYYRLRTDPQLFVTNEEVPRTIYDNGIIIDSTIKFGRNSENKFWKDYAGNIKFPYIIRNSADSLPCTVFYKDTTNNTNVTYLGQYVLMEDKKSDFCYGQRSIYKTDYLDPYCITIPNNKKDVALNRIWDNKGVLRIEVLTVDNTKNVNASYASYRQLNNLEDIVYNDAGQPVKFNWETDFELIYPDPDDIIGDSNLGTDKFGENSKFLKTVKPFLDFYKWLAGTYNNHDLFRREASEHLDLYKLAAYYIFFLKFGLVDSVERNAQLKTYDGEHWHYEPWDMDIGLGKRNTGGLAFDPPMTRETTLPGNNRIYAFSGTYNWLWNALEAWSYWSEVIVPKVANALYNAGLTYENMNKMFDEEYSNKWSEILYNESESFKYLAPAFNDTSWLLWLQGSGITYRHWWLYNSNNYYNSKWACGEFRNYNIYIGVDDNFYNTKTISITPTVDTFYSIAQNENIIITTDVVYKDTNVNLDLSNYALSAKVPLHIYGANTIKKLDLSTISIGIATIDFTGIYSNVSGTSLEELNIGTYLIESDNSYTGYANNQSQIALSVISNNGDDSWSSLKTLNIRGVLPYNGSVGGNFQKRTELQNFHAMCTGLTSFENAMDGNKFNILELPAYTYDKDNNEIKNFKYLTLNNAEWNSLEFWNTNILNDENLVKCTKYLNKNNNSTIPTSITTLKLLGTTGHTEQGKDLVLNWINNILDTVDENNLNEYSLTMDDILWDETTCNTQLTFEDLEKIAKINHNLKGKIVLTSLYGELTASQIVLLKQWYGEDVFTINSAGLTIDQKLNYIRIAISGKNVSVEDGVITVLESSSPITLAATKFSLSASSDEYTWTIRLASSQDTVAYLNAGKTYIILNEIYPSLATLMVGETNPSNSSSLKSDYDIVVSCISTSGNNLSGDINIHVKQVKYPTNINVDFSGKYNKLININRNPTYCIYKQDGNIIFDFNYDYSLYNASISNVQFSITDSSNKTLMPYKDYLDFYGEEILMTEIGNNIGFINNIKDGYKFNLTCFSLSEDEEYYFNVLVKFIYKSGHSYIRSFKLLVLDDFLPLILQNNTIYPFIVNSIRESGDTDSIDNSIYKLDLKRIIKFEIDTEETCSLVCNTGYSIFKYLKTVQQYNLKLVLNSIYSNSIIETNKSQLRFDYLPKDSYLYVHINVKTTDTQLLNIIMPRNIFVAHIYLKHITDKTKNLFTFKGEGLISAIMYGCKDLNVQQSNCLNYIKLNPFDDEYDKGIMSGASTLTVKNISSKINLEVCKFKNVSDVTLVNCNNAEFGLLSKVNNTYMTHPFIKNIYISKDSDNIELIDNSIIDVLIDDVTLSENNYIEGNIKCEYANTKKVAKLRTLYPELNILYDSEEIEFIKSKYSDITLKYLFENEESTKLYNKNKLANPIIENNKYLATKYMPAKEWYKGLYGIHFSLTSIYTMSYNVSLNDLQYSDAENYDTFFDDCSCLFVSCMAFPNNFKYLPNTWYAFIKNELRCNCIFLPKKLWRIEYEYCPSSSKINSSYANAFVIPPDFEGENPNGIFVTHQFGQSPVLRNIIVLSNKLSIFNDVELAKYGSIDIYVRESIKEQVSMGKGANILSINNLDDTIKNEIKIQYDLDDNFFTS